MQKRPKLVDVGLQKIQLVLSKAMILVINIVNYAGLGNEAALSSLLKH